VTYAATLIEGVLVEVKTNGDVVSMIGHPLEYLKASTSWAFDGVRTITVNGLPLAGTRYTIAVSTIASGIDGTVESAAGRVTISTAKFPAPKSVKVLAALAMASVNLTWRNYSAPGSAAVTEYQLYQLDADKNIVNVVVATNFTSSGGTFDLTEVRRSLIESSGKFTFYLRAIAEGVESLGARVTLKI
jgi:hypothetical protein